MNKIFMTKRRHDGEIAVCSELTRSKGKMKSFVAAVATAAALATPVAEGATASAVIDTNTNDRQKFYATFYDYDPENDSYTPKSGYLSDPDDTGRQYELPENFDEFLYGTPPNGYKPINEDKPIFSKPDPTIATSDETGLKDNYSNTLTFTKPGVKMQAAASWGNAFIINEKDVVLTIQDTDNTSNVTSNTTALTVTPQNPVKYTETNRGIGSNTEYKIDLNYNTTTLGLDDSGALTVIGGTGGSTTLPSTYFHVNGPGMKAGGDATTNLGEVDEYAGATGTSSIAAGVNAKATGASSVAVGAGATSGSGDRSVAVGSSAKTNGNNATAVGENALALQTQALALGSTTNATAKQSIAIGNDVEAKGYSSIAIGSDDTGTKTISTNKRDGANTEYSTFVYDAAQEEMVSNPYVKVEAKNAGKTGAPTALSYTATLTSADPNATGETTKTVVFARNIAGPNSSKKLTTEQLNLIKSLELTIPGSLITANTYEQLKSNKDVILINADSSDDDIRAAVAFAKGDPLNYRARLLAKFRAEAVAAAEAAGLPPLSDADANAAAQSSLAALASKMGQSSVDAYIKAFYNTYQKTTTAGVGAIAQGAKAIAMADGAVAIGTAASAMSRESLALGVATVTTGERAIGVGSLAVASGDRSVAIGTYTNRPDSTLGETRYDSPRALGDDAVAIGAGAYVGVDVLGTKSVALGAGSIVTTGYGDLKEDLITGEWVGTVHNYKSYDPNKTPGVNEKGETHKQFTRGNTTTGGSTGTVDKAYVGRIIYRDFAGATAVGAVSVGYSGAEKRIQNVAAGEISPTSTDAINGSQLYIATFETGYQIESSHFHTNDGTGTQEEGDTETNKGKLAETAGARSNYTTTAGIAARAVGEAAVAVGHHTLTGLTEAKYAEMVVIDKALAKHKEDRQKAQDKLEAAKKTLDLAASRLPILRTELNNYMQSLQDLERKITAAAGNPDEFARLTEQRAKMLASKQLIDDQITKLTTDQAQANTDKQDSEIAITDLDGKIGEAKTQLANFLTANAKDHAVALGSNIEASGEKSVAIGKDVKVSGNQSIAVGYGNVVSGNNSGAFGDPSIVAGAGSYTQGNDNAVGSQAKNVGAFGNNNQIGATATYVDGKLQTASGLTNESAVENSRVVGNNNYINTNNTYVLGSGVGVDGTTNFGTVENSVYLGNDSTVKDSDVAITKNNVGTVKNLTKGNVAGSTSTAGSKGTVTNAELFGVTYGEFAGATAKGAVTVGSAGEERRIMNVAAGEISNTSTDAINGSQLYYVAKQAVKPFTVTANSNKDTDAQNWDKQYAGGDGKQVQLGQTFSITGAGNAATDAAGSTFTRNTDTATAGDYSAKNVRTVVDDQGVQIQFAEKPEFKEVTAKDGNNVSKLSPTNITTTDGTSTTTIAPNSITVGDKAGDTDKPITISSTTTDGNTKNVIDGLTNNLPETRNTANGENNPVTKTQAAPTDTAINNNAATVGDVLNAGWNLKTQDQAVDFVKPYDTVNIKGDGAVKVAGENTDGATSTVTISVETTTLKDEKKVGDNNTLVDGKDGKVDAPAEGDKNKLVTAENIANAINNSGFTLKSSAVENQGEKLTGTQTGDEVINPGDVIEMVAGKNMAVKQDQNGKITYATKDNVEFNTVKVGTTGTGTGTDTKKTVELKTENAKPATNNPDTNKPTTALDIKSTDGKPTQITGVGSVLNTQDINVDKDGNKENGTPAGSEKLVNLNGTEQAPVNKNAAATVGDLQNMGWVVKATGNAYSDVVKNANEVNFVGTNLAKVTGETKEGIRTITVDVNAQNVTNKSQLPVEYTKADGTKVYPKVAEDGTVTYTTNPDGTGDVVPNNEVITSVNGPDGTTNPTTLTNVKSTLPGSVGNTLTGDNDATKVAAPDFTTPNAADAKKLNNAATVSDVLSAGWNLQGNGVAKDFVKPYDTVNFINGDGTTVEVKTDQDGKLSTIKVNTAMRYTDSAGNPLVKNDADGKFYPPTTDGKPDTTKTGVNAGDVQLSTINPDGTSTTATKLGNVAQGAGTLDGTVDANGQPLVKVGNQYYTPDQFVNGKLKNDAQPTTPAGTTNAAYNGLADLNSANPTNVMTVADAKNLGWVVSASGNGYADDVRNANKVDFVGTGLAKVTGETKGGIRTITVNVDAQKTVEAADTPVIYTDADGNKLVKGEDGKFYKPADIENLVFNPTDKKYYPAGTTFNDQGVANNNVQPSTLTPASNVIASMNDGDNKADSPKQLANVGGSLTPTYNTGDAKETDGKLGNTTADTPTKSQTAPTAENVKKMYNNAATVGDVLNAGWNLQGNGEAKDFVKPYDTVNFADGTGTKVDVSTDADGKVSTVKVNVDKGTLTAQNGKLVGSDLKDDQNNPLTAEKAQEALDAAKAELAAVPENAEQAVKDAAATKVAEAQKAVDAFNKVATVENVVDAINKSGFNLKSSAVKGEGEKLTGTQDDGELINPSETVEMIAGKNLTVKQDASGKITYATVANPEFDTVKIVGKDNDKLVATVDDQTVEVVKVGNDYYKATDVENGQAKPNTQKLTDEQIATVKPKEATVDLNRETGIATKELDKDGNDKNPNTPATAPTALSVKDSNNKDSQINGIASSLNTKDVETKPAGTTGTTATDKLVDLTEPTDPDTKAKWKSSAVTVGDIANMGWIVSATGNGYNDTVKNANQVDFVGTGLVTVTGETKGGIRTITVNVDAQKTVEAADTPVIYTDADGNKLVKGEDGNFYPAGSLDNLVFNPKDKKYYPAGTTFNEQGQPNPKDGKTPEAISPVTNVIASMNDGDNTADSPKQLANVKSTLADTDSVKADGTAEDGTPVVKATNGNYYAADTKMGADGNPVDPNAQPIAENKVTKTPTTVTTSAPITAQEAAKLANSSAKNNAATVGDVLNAGWNLQGNGSAVDFVKPYDTVNFVDGAGTKVEVTTDGQVSNVKVNVDAGKVTTVTKADPTSTADAPKPAINTGKVAGPIETALKAANKTDDQIKEITDKLAALNAAKEALANNKDDAKKAELEAAVTAKTNELTTALGENSPVKVEDLAKLENKVATAQDIANAINNTGFTLKADKTDGDNLTAETLKGGELINPGDTVTMQAGKNMTVKQEANGKVTYATKDDVEFNTVQVGGKVDDQGNKLVKVGDNYYKETDLTTDGKPKENAQPVENANVKDAPSVVFSADKGIATKELDKNGNDKNPNTPATAPTALSVKDKDGKDSQINGIASSLNTKEVETKPAGTTGTTTTDKLVDLTYPKLKDNPTPEETKKYNEDKAKWKSSAVTVGDIANMGWIVSATGNGYNDTVKNANQVDFVGTGLVTVTGETKGGIRTITVNVDAQKTVEAADTPVIYTDADGNKLVKGEDGNFYPAGSLDNLVFNPKDKKYYPAGTTFNEQGQPNPKDGKTPEAISPVTNVIASMNDGDNTADSPKQLANVKSTLADTDSVKADGTAEDGTPVVKATNGNYYAADTKMGADGNPVDPNAQPIAENKVTKTPTTVTTSAPITAQEAAKLANSSAKNNAATVGDVLNAGWNLQGNGSAVDFVKPYDTVNFVDGAGTKVEVTTDGQVSNVKVNVDAGKVTTVTKADPTSTADAPKPAINTGKVAGPIETALKAANKTDDQIKEITDKLAALNAAKEALANNKDDAKKAELEAAVTAKTNELTTALGENSPVKVEDLAKLENKVATAQDIANAINNTGFTLKADKTDGDNLTAETLKGGELINPGDTVTMQAGKNMTVKQEANGKVTYATKDDVEFNTVQVGGKVDDQGNKLVKVGDNYYKETDLTTDGKPKENAQPVENANVKDAPSVVFSADKGIATKELDKNGNDKNPNTPATAPTALSVKDKDGKDSQINGIASALDTKEVETKPTGKEGAVGTDTLVDLTYPTLPENATDEEKEAHEAAKAKWESSAVTVGDIANMGWIVSASGNEYTDTVKNANKVEFKGENGISVTGKTTANGVREITVSLEKGEVIGVNEGTVKIDGKDTDVVKVGGEYFKKEDIDPTTGKPKEGTTALGNDVVGNNGKNVVNNGNKLVDGHTVAKAIQESGFTVGKETDTSGVDFNNSDEKVNPNDELRFADGKGTTVSTGTVKTIDPNGEVSTKTVVKVDIDQGDMDADGGKLIDKILDDAEKAVEEKQAIVKDLAANPDNINDLIKAANDLKAAQDALAKLEEALDPDTAAAREKVTAAENALKQLSKEENPNVNDLIKAAKDVEDARNELTKAKDAAPNKVATVADVVEAVNRTGFTLKTSANGGTKISGDDELINPADTIDMAAGKNLTVKQDANGKVTYATAENVNFTSVQFGDNGPKISADGNNIKVGDKDGKPVKITNVKDGDITKDSTDAVNGSQIYALTGGAETKVADVTVTNPKTGEKKVIKDVIVDKDGNPALVTYNVDERGEYIQNSVISAINHMNTQGIKYFHTRDGSNRNTDDQQFNGEDSRATGKFSTAIGYQAHAEGDNAVAFGNNTVAGEQGVAIGHGAVASGKQSISIGTGNVVSGNNSGAIGGPNTIKADRSYALGNNNQVNAGQSDVFVVGNNVKNTTSNSVFLGSNSGYVAASETTAGTAALESQVTGGVYNAYAGGKASEVKGVVSVGNVNSDGTMETRRIQNVAPGLISEKSTDAINGSQLYSVVASQNAQIGDIYNKMDREHKGLRAGIASAAALAGIPEVHVAGRSMIAASASAYKSENAVAVGYSRLSDNSKIKLKLTGSANTRGDVMGTVGVGYMW